MADWTNILQRAAPLLSGAGFDIARGGAVGSSGGLQAGIAQMQEAQEKRAQEARMNAALQRIGVSMPADGGAAGGDPMALQGAAGVLGGAQGGGDGGQLQGAAGAIRLPAQIQQAAQAMAASGDQRGALDLVGRYQVAQATQPPPSPWDNYKIAGGDVIGINEQTGRPEAVYQGRDSGQSPLSPIAKLADDYRNGRIDKETFELQRKKMLESGGMRLETNADGSLTFATGGQAASLGRAGQNALDIKEIDARDSLARLDRIEGNLADPAFLDSLTGAGALKRLGLEWQDYLAPETMTTERQEDLFKITQARSDVLDNVNYTIKAITGAAMTEPEAKRIGATLPTVKDTPIMFKAKLETAMRRTKMAIARYNMWRSQGLGGSPDKLGTLGDIERQVETRKADLMSAVQAGEITADQASAMFLSEFGI